MGIITLVGAFDSTYLAIQAPPSSATRPISVCKTVQPKAAKAVPLTLLILMNEDWTRYMCFMTTKQTINESVGVFPYRWERCIYFHKTQMRKSCGIYKFEIMIQLYLDRQVSGGIFLPLICRVGIYLPEAIKNRQWHNSVLFQYWLDNHRSRRNTGGGWSFSVFYLF